ncbi:triose-phosphate isomerase [Maricaulis sp. MIT060901]|uniref:triose-phosphate isomerase n=1 Tax=Maricaulis sp. MIT060901 TaxID=3096993 RepID=UPI00399C26FB
MARQLIAGNWKMNGLSSQLSFFDDLVNAVGDSPAELLICPPATLIERCSRAADGSGIAIGAQDCHVSASGAHTGDLSVAMLADAGARFVILGHSERRADHGETSAEVKAKAEAVLAGGLTSIICVGETLEQREQGNAETVVTEQLLASLPENAGDRCEIAYEPVWAIGTGRTASSADIVAMHGALKAALPAGVSARILYGGSVKPQNAEEILGLDNVDGALVGGASLNPVDFAGIIKNTRC